MKKLNLAFLLALLVTVSSCGHFKHRDKKNQTSEKVLKSQSEKADSKAVSEEKSQTKKEEVVKVEEKSKKDHKKSEKSSKKSNKLKSKK